MRPGIPLANRPSMRVENRHCRRASSPPWIASPRSSSKVRSRSWRWSPAALWCASPSRGRSPQRLLPRLLLPPLTPGWGMYAPARVLANAELSTMVETSDEWIVTRTGIRERRIAADDETTTTLSVNASRDALAVAGLDASDLDLVIVATCSPDYPLPATGVLVATELGARHAAGFDMQAACSGFVFGLATATSFIRSGMYRNVLLVGVEVLSRFIDWTDRNTCVLFGDGAGAVVLQASDQPGGLLGFDLYSDGNGAEAIIVPGGGSNLPAGPASVADR